MPGNTATIDLDTLRMQWNADVPMVAICTHWTITKDQLIRLRDVLPLEKRHDRSRRFKPRHDRGPSPEEEEASRSSLALAPEIAARTTCVQVMWSHETRMARQTAETSHGLLRWIKAPELMRRFIKDESAG
jgi:hypothetical protein